MNRKIPFMITLLLFWGTAMADQQECSLVLSKPSLSWVMQTSEKAGGSTQALVHALSQYARCVDQSSQQMYAQLLKSGNYPLMGANASFRDFSSALKNFTDLALKLTATGGTWDNTQTAYVQLYQRQFKILFYAEYSKDTSCSRLSGNTCKDTQNPLLKRLKNTKRPSLQESKAYFEKIIQRFPPTQRQALTHSFNQLSSIASTENHFDESYI
jgi:hypothetical protein